MPQQGHPSDAHPTRLAIEASDVYSLDGIAMSRAELGEKLAGLVATGRATVLEVQASSEAEYESVAQGVAIARRAGIESVVLVDR